MAEAARGRLRRRRAVIAVDTNILVYAHRVDTPFHGAAKRCVAEQIEGRATWAIPWPCVHEFLAVVTRPRIFDPPTPLARALDQVDAWLASPSLVLLNEDAGYWEELRTVLGAGHIVGGHVHDARIAALCVLHGVRELWTADRDFTRFPYVLVRNPLIDHVSEGRASYGRRRRVGRGRTAVARAR